MTLPKLNGIQETHRKKMRSHGLVHCKSAILAANAVDMPLPAACALLSKESMGQNIYGHDSGGYFSVSATGTINVTEQNFGQFYRAVVEEGHTSNGVGPCQITYRGYFPQMKAQGLKAWVPYDNMRFGFRILMGNFNGSGGHSWMVAGGLYNGGPGWRSNAAATQYGVDLSHRVTEWSKILDG